VILNGPITIITRYFKVHSMASLEANCVEFVEAGPILSRSLVSGNIWFMGDNTRYFCISWASC